VRTVSLPLRISRDGQLERGDATEQVIRLIQAMVATTAGAWPHAPWFGLHELFTEANLALAEQQTLLEAVNAALEKLGVTWARVASMKTARDAGYGVRQFAITLVVDGEPTVQASIVS
jgi:hypothetical protein